MVNRRPRFDKETDQRGPVPVGVAVQERAATGAVPKPRLVLFSSRRPWPTISSRTWSRRTWTW